MTVIVDTNVAWVASGRSEQASEDCVDTCIERLEQINNDEVKLGRVEILKLLIQQML